MTRPASASSCERGHAALHQGKASCPEYGLEYGRCDGSHRRGPPVPDADRDRCVTRECLAVEPGHPFGAADVVRVLSALAAARGAPRWIVCDNGSECAGRLVDLWAYANKVTLAFSRPGKPTDHASIESFNGSLREECVNVHGFEDFTDAWAKLQA